MAIEISRPLNNKLIDINDAATIDYGFSHGLVSHAGLDGWILAR